jgi:hypothetical protein
MKVDEQRMFGPSSKNPSGVSNDIAVFKVLTLRPNCKSIGSPLKFKSSRFDEQPVPLAVKASGNRSVPHEMGLAGFATGARMRT